MAPTISEGDAAILQAGETQTSSNILNGLLVPIIAIFFVIVVTAGFVAYRFGNQQRKFSGILRSLGGKDGLVPDSGGLRPLLEALTPPLSPAPEDRPPIHETRISFSRLRAHQCQEPKASIGNNAPSDSEKVGVNVEWVISALQNERNETGYYDFTLKKVPPRRDQARLSILCEGESNTDLYVRQSFLN
jgi:hypothetical protein